MNILDQLAEHARQRVEAAKQTLPLAEIKRQALSLPKGDFRFEKALAKPGLAFICECKKHRPPRGSSHRSSRTCRSPENTKPPGQMPSRC